MILLSNEVTQADFITALEEEEVLELSELYDPTNPVIDTIKIDYALSRAHDELNVAFIAAGNCGKAMIKTNARSLVIAIARVLLDTVKARPHVQEDARYAREQLQYYQIYDDKYNCPLSQEQLEEILGFAPPFVDNALRASSSPRKWKDEDFALYQKRLFDARSIRNTNRINRRYYVDDL